MFSYTYTHVKPYIHTYMLNHTYIHTLTLNQKSMVITTCLILHGDGESPKKEENQKSSWRFSFFLSFLKFILREYSVTVFRHTRRAHQIPSQMTVSHRVVAGN